MASQRMIRREKKRIELVNKLYSEREALKAQLKDPALDLDQKFEIVAKLEKMPRDSSYARLSHRCQVTGRAHGVLRWFKLARGELRRRILNGEVPGMVKSSW